MEFVRTDSVQTDNDSESRMSTWARYPDRGPSSKLTNNVEESDDVGSEHAEESEEERQRQLDRDFYVSDASD